MKVLKLQLNGIKKNLENKLKLSVIICVFNEIKTIDLIIEKVLRSNLPDNIKKEIIIIDNNSFDGTKDKLKKYENIKNIKIIYNNKNYGKGYSIRLGIKEAKGDFVIFQDADLEYDPKDYIKLLNHLISKKIDFVYGSRILNNKKYHIYNIHKYAVVFFTLLINTAYKSNFTDTATNYKLFRSKIIKNIELNSNSFAIDFEITIRLVKKGYLFDEIPISYYPRKYIDGKKINIIDAFKSFLMIINLIIFK